jgi:hypothetical protein
MCCQGRTNLRQKAIRRGRRDIDDRRPLCFARTLRIAWLAALRSALVLIRLVYLFGLLGWGRDALSEAVREINANAGIDQLARARREGLVKIENADPGDEMDLLASCIISAKLAQAGQRQDNPQAGRVVETFVDKL